MKNRKIEIIVLIFFIILVAILSAYILIPKIEERNLPKYDLLISNFSFFTPYLKINPIPLTV